MAQILSFHQSINNTTFNNSDDLPIITMQADNTGLMMIIWQIHFLRFQC